MKRYSYTQKDKFDRFYTRDKIAENLVSNLNLREFNKIIEPSAGGGAFVKAIKKLNFNCFAYDLDPLTDWIIQDWLATSFVKDKILVIGNPPFGKNGSLAIKFINHSAKFAEKIAFILPNSFKKQSMVSKLDKNIEIEKIIDIPKDSFIFENKIYEVPCSFFIFKVLEFRLRKKIFNQNCDLFSFTIKENADFSIRRVGVNAGKIGTLECSPSSNYFIKSNINIQKLQEILNRCDFQSLANNTLGPPSLSKQEIVGEVLKNI